MHMHFRSSHNLQRLTIGHRVRVVDLDEPAWPRGCHLLITCLSFLCSLIRTTNAFRPFLYLVHSATLDCPYVPNCPKRQVLVLLHHRMLKKQRSIYEIARSFVSGRDEPLPEMPSREAARPGQTNGQSGEDTYTLKRDFHASSRFARVYTVTVRPKLTAILGFLHNINCGRQTSATSSIPAYQYQQSLE